MNLQRLTYPFRELSVPQGWFGESVGKYTSIKDFFTCAATGAANVSDGALQATLDNLYEKRKAVVGQRFEGGKMSPDLYLLGSKDALVGFRHKIANFSRNSGHVDGMETTQKPVAERLLEEFLTNSHSNDILLDNTMGWLDVDSGCFAMKSMTSLNRVRELFGMRPHVAMRAQKFNYAHY